MFWLELSQYVWIFISPSLLHRWCLVDVAYCSYVQLHPCNDFQLQTTNTNAHNLLMTPTGNSSAKRIMVRALGFQSLVSHTQLQHLQFSWTEILKESKMEWNLANMWWTAHGFMPEKRCLWAWSSSPTMLQELWRQQGFQRILSFPHLLDDSRQTPTTHKYRF
jgi:hypothetical protein